MKYKKLEEVCDFISGLWTGKKPPYVNVGVIRNTNFHKNGNLDLTDIAQLDVETKQFSTRQLKYGDIVLEKSGGGPNQPVGRVCVFEIEDGLYSLSNFTSAVRVKNPSELSYKYLHYFLKYLYITGETEKIQTHSTGIRNLQLSLYKEFKVPIPPLPIQQKIVEKLDAIFIEVDKGIETAEISAINTEALFRSYLTEIIEKDSADCEVVKIGNVCEIARGGSPRPIDKFITDSEDGVNWIKIGDATRSKKYIFETREKIIKEGVSRSRFVNDGDFLLSNSMSFGRPYIMRTTGCIHDGWLVLTNYQKHLDIDFFYYLLSSPIVVRQFEKLAQGSTVRNLNKELVSRVEVRLPSLAKQKKIVLKLDALDSNLELAKKSYKMKSTQLTKLKKSILHQAFNGELIKE